MLIKNTNKLFNHGYLQTLLKFNVIKLYILKDLKLLTDLYLLERFSVPD